LVRAVRHLPVVPLSALRRSGKSTMLQKEAGLAAGHPYRFGIGTSRFIVAR
jgi:hypothetical protein